MLLIAASLGILSDKPLKSVPHGQCDARPTGYPVADSGGMRGMRPHTLLTGLDAFL